MSDGVGEVEDLEPSAGRALDDQRAVWRRGPWEVSKGLTLTVFAAVVPSRELPRVVWVLRILPPLLLGVLNRVLLVLFPGRHPAPAVERRTGEHPARGRLVGSPDAPSSDAKKGFVASRARRARLAAYSALDASIAYAFGDDRRDFEAAAVHGVTHDPVERVDAYLDIFRVLPTPPLAQRWTEPHGGLSDELFAWLRVAGPNPEVIVRVDAVPEGFPEALIAETDGALFVADYHALTALAASDWRGIPRWVGAPRALFGVRRGALFPLAIERVRGGPVVRPGEPGWILARHAVQVADMNHHELCSHLGRTHLLCELFLLATRRELIDGHPVARLLIPHFEGTLFINHLARTSLIADKGPIEQVLGAEISSSREFVVADLKALAFETYDLPRRTARRRTEPITCYPFRDDALRVWGVIERFVHAYVHRAYASETALQSDEALQGWCAVLARPMEQGGVAGFEPPRDREALTRVLTLVIYTASAQHAAVNFPQYPELAFAPLASGAGWSDPALATGDGDGEALARFFPPRPIARQQAEMLHLLSSVCHAPLGTYDEGCFADPAVQPMVEEFQRGLRALGEEIDVANDARSWPYPYLRPSQIPRSVNI